MGSYTARGREREKAKKRGQRFAEKINNSGFFPSRRDVLFSKEYQRLGASAVKLFHDVSAHWNGKNNGDLCVTYSVMNTYHGWASNATLRRALKELLDARFLVLTREGDRNRPALYALTTLPIDECLDDAGFSKIHIKPEKRAPDWWRDEFKDKFKPKEKPTTNINT